MNIRLHDEVRVLDGHHKGQVGTVVSLLPKDDTRVVVYIYHNGVTTWPHLLKSNLRVVVRSHPSCR